MPRRPRLSTGGIAYHVLNRRVGRLEFFEKPADYSAFEIILAEAHRRTGIRIAAYFLSPWPTERPQNWIELINEPDKISELDDLRSSAQRGRPFGSEDWMINSSKQLGLETTMHSRGRPKRK